MFGTNHHTAVWPLSVLIFLSVVGFYACNNYTATSYDYPDPVDTSDKPIEEQEKKTWSFDGVYADNQFDGARLNGFSQVDKNTFRAEILPENFPINESPWYAFKLWSDRARKIELILDYTHAKHRYIPKLSTDGVNWTPIDSNSIVFLDTADVRIPVQLDTIPMYFSAQELYPSASVYSWCDTLDQHPDVTKGVYGKSVQGKDLVYLDVFQNTPEDKPLVVLLSRQHPPEITGYLAMQGFVATLLDTNILSTAFRAKFRILMMPMLNPDGVDMGHWRHNAHGVDLNRDWGIYVQPEIRQTVDFIVREQKMKDNDVVLGLDFHSTQKDIFYTYVDSMVSVIPAFNDYWIMGIDEALPEYTPAEEPSGLTQPYSKVWFYTQFGAEAVTYEFGDETPRDFIRQKARVSAMEMMKLLLYYDSGD